jgi:hypothetical protein
VPGGIGSIQEGRTADRADSVQGVLPDAVPGTTTREFALYVRKVLFELGVQHDQCGDAAAQVAMTRRDQFVDFGLQVNHRCLPDMDGSSIIFQAFHQS